MSVTSCELQQVYEDCAQECVGITECQLVVEDVLEVAAVEAEATMHTQLTNFEQDPLSLSQEIQEYKVQLRSLRDENTLLKVKLRRLEDIVKKKNKVCDMHYLGAHNKLRFRTEMKQFTQHIETLQEENRDLKEELMDKDSVIRKLRKNLNVYTAYKPASQQSKKKPASAANSTRSRPSRATILSQDDAVREITETPLLPAVLLSKLQLKDIPNDDEDDFIIFEDAQALSTKASDEEEHDTDRAVSCSLLLDAPHEEIEKLHTGFKDIITEVSKLKKSVGELNEKQIRTMSELRLREREMMTRLYDKRQEFPYHNLQTSPGLKRERQVPVVATGDTGRTSMRTTFARIPKPNKSGGKPKNTKRNPFAVRTASRGSLHDETDMRLYIDEVLNELNRSEHRT